MRFLGLDIGTTTITGLVLDVVSGEVLGIHTAPNASETTRRDDREKGRSEWDAEAMVQTAIRVVRDAAQEAGDIRGIGVTGQMHGMLLAGSDGEPQGPFVGWQDRRGMEVHPGSTETYVDSLARMAKTTGGLTRGCRPHSGYMGVTLFWMAANGLLPEDGVTASFMPDYIVSRLTGQAPVTDPTDAASSALFDVVGGCWHTGLLSELGLSGKVLPRVKSSATCAGGLTKAVSGQTGLPEGLPVGVACGDNQASFAGSVGDYSDSVLVNVGTGGQVSAYAARAESCGELEARPFMDGGCLLVGAGLVGGRSYAWLRDFFRGIGRVFFNASGDEDLYEAMNLLASEVASGSDGLTCEPVFTGTRRRPDRRGLWAGVGTANFTPGHMARALLEGLSEQFYALYGEMGRQHLADRTKLVGSGNGIRANSVLREILAARFGMELLVPAHREEAAFGAALLGAVSEGVLGDLREGGGLIRYI